MARDRLTSLWRIALRSVWFGSGLAGLGFFLFFLAIGALEATKFASFQMGSWLGDALLVATIAWLCTLVVSGAIALGLAFVVLPIWLKVGPLQLWHVIAIMGFVWIVISIAGSVGQSGINWETASFVLLWTCWPFLSVAWSVRWFWED